MTSSGSALRVLLLSDSATHVKDMLQAWKDLQTTVFLFNAMELVHCILTPKTEGLGTVLALLDRIRAGFLYLVFVVKPSLAVARSRGGLLVSANETPAGTAVSDQASTTFYHAEFCFWVSQQALECKSCKLVLLCSEVTGSHLPCSGTSLWSFRELKNLDKVQGAQRGAEFLCQLSDGDAAIRLASSPMCHFSFSLYTQVGQFLRSLHRHGPTPVLCLVPVRVNAYTTHPQEKTLQKALVSGGTASKLSFRGWQTIPLGKG